VLVASSRFKAATNGAHDLPVAPNLLARNFTVDAPNKVWTGDSTRGTRYNG